MFKPNMADKYASTVTKNLGLGYNSWPCSAGYLLVMHSFSVGHTSFLPIIEVNTSYLIDSYIVFTLKMKSVSQTTIFGLIMMVKSGLEKIFLKFLHAEAIFF